MNNTTKELISQQDKANIKLITENVSNSIHKLFSIISIRDNYYDKKGDKSKVVNVSELTSSFLKFTQEMDSELSSIIKVLNINYKGFNPSEFMDGLLQKSSVASLLSFFGIKSVSSDNTTNINLSKFLLEFLITFVKSPEKLSYEQIYRMSLITAVSTSEVMEIVNLWSKQDSVWEKSNEKYKLGK